LSIGQWITPKHKLVLAQWLLTCFDPSRVPMVPISDQERALH
jgi:hypothetical protein